jgi:SOS-response transcriptional repressor LexA
MAAPDFALLDWIERLALAGEACPTNEEIAERFGLSCPKAGLYRLRRLERDGLIEVERFHRARRVTVLRSGLSTFVSEPAAARPRRNRQGPGKRPERVGRPPRGRQAGVMMLRPDDAGFGGDNGWKDELRAASRALADRLKAAGF